MKKYKYFNILPNLEWIDRINPSINMVDAIHMVNYTVFSIEYPLNQLICTTDLNCGLYSRLRFPISLSGFSTPFVPHSK